jgi:hypothetical protein
MLLNKELTYKIIQDIITAVKEGVRKWLRLSGSR